EPRLAQDLEAIARPEHDPAAGDELGQGFDHRRPAGDRPRAQVVAVREAAGKDDAVELGQVAVAMPDVLDRLLEHFADDVVEVAVTPRTREHDHAKSHGADGLLSPCGFTRPTTHPYLKRGPASRQGTLDGEVLGDRVGEELPAHLLDARGRRAGV